MKQLSILFVLGFIMWGSTTAQDLGIPGLDYNANASPQVIGSGTGDEVLTTLTWSAMAPSTHAVSRSCVAFITIGGNDYVYQFGGGSGAQFTTVVRYDVAANTWSGGFASIPSAMSSASAVTIGDKIYLFGGENAAGLGRTYMYDPVANTWTTKANMLTLVTDALVVKLNDNYVYVIGGGNGLFGAVVFSSVQLYNVTADTYTACTSLPAALGMMGGGMLNYTIIATGGWTGTTGSPVTYKGAVNPGDLTQITWTPVANYPTGGVTRMASFPVTLGAFPAAAGFFCTGGAVNGATLTGATNLYNFCTDSWETLTPNLSLARSNFKGAGNMDNVVYVIGGFTTVGVGNNDRATLTDIAGNCFTPIPVELTSFAASVQGKNVNLSWTTASEINNQGFEVQRKTNNAWETIAFISGNGTTTESKSYSYTDDISSINISTILYRLKQIDFDGTYEYSFIVEVDGLVPDEYLLEQNYPNPFNPSTSIKYQLPENGFVTIKVYDMLGNEIATLVNEVQEAGNHSVEFDAATVSSGIYFYIMQAGNFTQTKKMTLLK